MREEASTALLVGCQARGVTGTTVYVFGMSWDRTRNYPPLEAYTLSTNYRSRLFINLILDYYAILVKTVSVLLQQHLGHHVCFFEMPGI